MNRLKTYLEENRVFSRNLSQPDGDLIALKGIADCRYSVQKGSIYASPGVEDCRICAPSREGAIIVAGHVKGAELEAGHRIKVVSTIPLRGKTNRLKLTGYLSKSEVERGERRLEELTKAQDTIVDTAEKIFERVASQQLFQQYQRVIHLAESEDMAYNKMLGVFRSALGFMERNPKPAQTRARVELKAALGNLESTRESLTSFRTQFERERYGESIEFYGEMGAGTKIEMGGDRTTSDMTMIVPQDLIIPEGKKYIYKVEGGEIKESVVDIKKGDKTPKQNVEKALKEFNQAL